MTIRIRSNVVDISTDKPKPEDKFLIDTNIWFWLTYSKASQSDRPPATYQARYYPNYIKAILEATASISRCGLSLAELSNLIEKTEREIYARASGAAFKATESKRFRHDCSSERTKVILEISHAWNQVVNMSHDLSISINNTLTKTVIGNLVGQETDTYDSFLLEAMKHNSIVQILTDDGDFATAAGFLVFTANRRTIMNASRQKKLVVR